MWFKESNIYFCQIKNFTYGEINERSFSNPHPCCFDTIFVNFADFKQSQGLNAPVNYYKIPPAHTNRHIIQHTTLQNDMIG